MDRGIMECEQKNVSYSYVVVWDDLTHRGYRLWILKIDVKDIKLFLSLPRSLCANLQILREISRIRGKKIWPFFIIIILCVIFGWIDRLLPGLSIIIRKWRDEIINVFGVFEKLLYYYTSLHYSIKVLNLII